jgi:hypothetical protein
MPVEIGQAADDAERAGEGVDQPGADLGPLTPQAAEALGRST